MPSPRRHLLSGGIVLALCLALIAGILTSLEVDAAPSEHALKQSAEPTFSKSFLPSTIGPGSVTTLQFTISNGATQVTDLAFVDNLPLGVTVALPGNPSTTCSGGSVVAINGAGTIEFSGGKLSANSSCTVSVNVTSSAAGTYTNTSGDLTSSAGNSGPASADLTVDTARPGFTKSFSPSVVDQGERSTLTFTIDNTDPNTADITFLSFTDNLPVGMVIADPSNAATDCQNPPLFAELTASSGTGTISLLVIGSALFPVLGAEATCSVSVDVVTTSRGDLGNTSGELTANNESSGKAGAVLTSNVFPLHLRKSFTNDPTTPGGAVNLQFSITNYDRNFSASDVGFSDVLPTIGSSTGLIPDEALPKAACGGSLDFAAGTLTFSGGTLAAGETCTFSVRLLVPSDASPGSHTNTTSQVSGVVDDSNVTGNDASENLYVQLIPVLSKEFIDDPVGTGGTVTLRYTIDGSSIGSPATAIAFLDELTTILPSPLNVVLPTGPPCGTGSSIVVVGTSFGQAISLSSGSLPAGGTCTFDVQISIPDGIANGQYTSISGPLSATVDGTTYAGQNASDDLLIVAAPTLRKLFVDDPVLPGANVAIEFTLTHNNNAPGDATNISFTDDLNAALPGLASVSGTQTNICGAGSSISGGSSLTFTGGTLSPGASCTFQVTLLVPVGAAPGGHVNATSDVSATVLGTTTSSPQTSDVLKIAGLILTKSFTDDPALPGGTVTLEFTINNISGEAATDIEFNDDLSSVLSGLTATGLPASDVCGSGSSLSGTSNLSLQGGSLGAGESCIFSVVLSVPVNASSNVYTNKTTGFQATFDGTSILLDNATDVLTISDQILSLTKSFTDDPVLPGHVVNLQFTLSNLSPIHTVSGIAFSDNLGAALAGLASTSGTVNDVCGTGSQVSGTSTIALSGATLGPGGTCIFNLSVQVPPSAVGGSVADNTTGTVSGLVGSIPVTGAAASDTLQIATIAVTAEAGGPYSVNEGSSLVITGTTTTTGGVIFDWDLDNDGSFETPGQTVTLSPADGDASFTIRFRVRGTDGNGAIDTASVTVNNMAPTVDLSGDASVDEGSPYALTLGAITDPGDDTVTQYIVHWGDGDTDTYTSSGPVNHTYADGVSSPTITVDLVDEDGTHSGAGSLGLTVNNVAPTIDLSGDASVDEGSPYALTLGAVTDPGDDTVTQYIVHWGDGDTDTYTSSGPVNHTYADGVSSPTITVDLVDEDGTHSGAGSLGLTVNNVAPTIDLSGDSSVNEGSPYALTLGAVTDPGDDTVTQYIVHWGDGDTDTYTSDGIVSHTYADGLSTPTITVDLVDEDGTHSGAGSLGLTVNNVAPTIDLSGDANVDEGSTYTLVLGAVTDPGDDTVTQYIVDWGDGNTNIYGSNGPVTHIYDDGPSTPTITVDLVDEDGTFTDAGTHSLTVDNVPPSATFNAPTEVNEGAPINLSLTGASDPSNADEAAGFTYAFDCGDGSGFSSFSSANSTTCPTAGNAGTRTVGGIIKDKDGGETPYSASVYVIPSREVKQNLRDALALLLPTGDKNDDKDIEKAIESIEDSLDDDYWETGSRLTKKGNKVFDEEKKAVKELQKVETEDVSTFILGLVEVDRVLAAVQIADAEAANGEPKYLEKAYERMADAQTEIAEGDFDKAIDDYKKAWEYARKAANKPVESASIDLIEEVEASFRLFLPMSAKQ